MIIIPVLQVCKLSAKEDKVEIEELVKDRLMTDPKNDNSRARTPTPCWPVGWWIQRCHQGAWRKWRRWSRSQPCGRPSRPSRVAWAQGMITAVWASTPFPLRWHGLRAGAWSRPCGCPSRPSKVAQARGMITAVWASTPFPLRWHGLGAWSQSCGRPSRPSRVVRARGGCLITAVWASIPSLYGGAVSGHDHSRVGIHPVPSRVAWARGGCLITAVWVSIPFPLGWSGLGVGAGRGFCTHSSVPGILQSSAAPESSPGWTVSKETWKGVGNLDRICWSLLTWKKSEYFAVISSAQTSFPAALAPKELGLRAAGQWGSPGLLY